MPVLATTFSFDAANDGVAAIAAIPARTERRETDMRPSLQSVKFRDSVVYASHSQKVNENANDSQ
jgi:hypothetical protein